MIANDITIQRSLMTWIEAIDYVFVLLLNPFFISQSLRDLIGRALEPERKHEASLKMFYNEYTIISILDTYH